MLKEACAYLLLAYRNQGLSADQARARLSEDLIEISRDYTGVIPAGYPAIRVLIKNGIEKAQTLGPAGIPIKNLLIDVEMMLQKEGK